MAADLIKMQLKENNIKDLEDGQFIQNLTRMLNSNSPAYKSACLKRIKKPLLYPQIVKQLLSDSVVIPLLLGLISFVRSDTQLKQEAGEILALLVGACQHPEIRDTSGRKELQSEHNVSLFLQFVNISDPETKIQFLHLLVELSSQSQTAQNLIRPDRYAVAQLFDSVVGDQREVKRWVLKLISCISGNHPDGVPLPPSPSTETAINTFADILPCSLDVEERSIAAAIISQLPKDDIIIDELLKKSEALKAIREKSGTLVKKMRSCEPRNPTVLYKAVNEKRNIQQSDLRRIGEVVFSGNTWSCYSTAFLNFLSYMYSSTSRKFKKAVEKHGSFRVFFLSFFSPSSLLVVMDEDIQHLFPPSDDRSKKLLSSFYLHAWIMSQWRAVLSQLGQSRPFASSTAPKFATMAHNAAHHVPSSRYSATGEHAPFYVMAGMVTVAVAMAFHTMKQQLVHSPGVSINKKRRESIAEVDDPDTVVADASKFLKKSFLRKVAHIQEHNPTLPDPTRANAITKYLYLLPLISHFSQFNA
ncbi:hypothetical protein D5086_007257 [Populus alba]|uniref:Uncharacterized protein n=1 Tax=Populus alba TaxID=43335 RepID=A0ACC4CMV6_POPAL